MKKFLIAAFILLLSINSSIAKNAEKNYSVKFDGAKYNLLFSEKNKDYGGYINEYYKLGETYNNWSEMFAVHHFPNAYSPIDRIISFREYLNNLKIPSHISFNEDENTAVIDFLVINTNKQPFILEFNIFKYGKSKECGSVAIQYARRYIVRNAYEQEAVKRDFEKNRKAMIKKVVKQEFPAIVTKDIDKCKTNSDKQETKTAEEIIPKTEAQQETNINDAEEIKINQDENKIDEIKETEKEPEKQIENKEEDKDTDKEEIKTEPVIKESSEVSVKEEDLQNNITSEKQKETVSEEKTEQQAKEVLKDNSEKVISEKEINQQVKNVPAPIGKTSEEEDSVKPIKHIKTKKDVEREKRAQKRNEKQNAPKNIKTKKEKTYYIINDKEYYIAKPRTQKEINARNKALKKSKRG